MKKTLVVNLFGGPGAGKSTFMAGIFYKLKLLGYNCEMAPEYAKDLVWEDSTKKLDNQLYVFGKQYHRLNRLRDKVDIIITDSPIVLSAIYDRIHGEKHGKLLHDLVTQEFSRFDNVSFYLNRREDVYQVEGRLQTLEQAMVIDNTVLEYLIDNNISFTNIENPEEQMDKMVEAIRRRFEIAPIRHSTWITQLDVINANDRIYTSESFDMESVMKNVKAGRLFGEFIKDYSDSYSAVNINNASHLVVDMYDKDGRIYCEIETLPNQNGANLKKLIQNGDVVFRSRSMGKVDMNRVVSVEELLAIDAIPKEKDAYRDIN